ncbi:MAG: sodium:solute symporter [Pirellulaceae bacterium]
MKTPRFPFPVGGLALLPMLWTAVPLLAQEESAAVADSAPSRFGPLDWSVLAIYFLGMVAVGCYCARRGSTSEDYFLAGGRIPWWAAGLSIYGSQLSAITFMAVPAILFTEGGNWTRIIGGWTILLIAPLIIFFYLPLFRRLKIQTAYEYLERRFHLAVRLVASAIFIIFQVGRMGVVLLLPAAAIAAATGINVLLAVVLMGILAMTYTVLGGIEAVIWTDVVQVVVLIGGAILCVGVATFAVGGPVEVYQVAAQADKLTLFDWSTDTSRASTWVLLVGLTFINLISYTTDQAVVQRYLATSDERAAARSIWLNGLMTIPTGFLFFALGTSLWVFYQVHSGALMPDNADQVVPWFIITQLPTGISGLVIAAIFAAAMSSLDSSMNAVASAFINDFWIRLRGRSQPEVELRLARLITLLIGIVGTGLALIIAVTGVTSLFDYFNLMLGMLGGGLAGVFLLAVFTTRAHWIGALSGLLVGSVATAVVHFHPALHVYLAGAAGTVTCFVVGYVVSWAVPLPSSDLTGLTIYTLSKRAEPEFSPELTPADASASQVLESPL